MCQQDFEADTNILANVTIGDLQEAQINENNHCPRTNMCDAYSIIYALLALI